MRTTRIGCWATWGAVVLLATAAAAPGQDRAKGQFKVVPLSELLAGTGKGKDKDKLDPGPTLVAALNRLGEEGWEAMAGGKRGILFRKAKEGQKWEYRAVRAPDSTLNGKAADDEILLLVLEGLAAQGWEPCPVMLPDQRDQREMLFRRQIVIPPPKL